MQTNTQQLNFVSKGQYHLFVKIIALVLIIANLAVLIGWHYHIPRLTSILSSWPSLKVNTAICFILSGITLLLLDNSSRLIARIITVTLSIIIMLIGSITIFEYITDLDWGIDQLLMKNSDSPHPGRMSFITAFNFIFVAFAFLFKKNILGSLSEIFAMLVFFMGLFSFYNYIFDANINYAIAAYTTMAALTTLLFMLLSVGILLTSPVADIVEIIFRNTSGGYYLRRILPAILFVPIIISFLENKLEAMNIIEGNLGDSIMAAGTFIILCIVISAIIRRMDREERKLISTRSQMRQDEMIFQQLFENIDIVIYRTSPDLNKILYINPAYEKIWGNSVESLYKNPKEWFDAILPEDQKIVYKEFFEGMRKGNATAYAEYRIKRPDGSIRNILARGFQLKDHNNIPFCITGIAIDITGEKQEKKYLHNRDDILQIMENAKTINEAAPQILMTICQMSNWDLGGIWLIDETKNILRFVNNWHIESEKLSQYNKTSRAHTFRLGEGLPGMIWQNRAPLWISDYSKRREISRSFDAEQAGLNCAFGMPIMFQDHVFGIMEFFSYRVQVPDEAMLSHMTNIGKLMGEFIHRVHTHDESQSLSRIDILTGLLNRSALEEDLNNLIKDSKLDFITIMVIDIDKFKLINEALGYDNGNLIIKSAAKRLGECIDQDKMRTARAGADKFILCFKIKNAEEILDFAHKVERSFREPFAIDKKVIFLTVSIGIAIYPQDGIDSKTLFGNADLALTSAKKNGGNKSILFTKELTGIALEKLAMHLDLHQAITKNQFLINYQPQIDLKTGDICCAEALVRWQHPVKGLISPADFIKFAEQTGLIVSLNEHIMHLVFQQVKSGWAGPPISVNISAQQFNDKYHLVEYVESLLNKYAVDPKHIEFEIAESVLMDDTQHNIAVIAALHRLGIQFAIDDFGTGYSSFNYLYRIPAHKIKIDKSFITGLPENQANAEIVTSMIAMFHSLGKIIVAEGVETDTEIEYLKKEKCDIVQGYYYYKPMSTDDFVTLISKVNKDKTHISS